MVAAQHNGYLEGVYSNELAFPLALTRRYHEATQAAQTAVDRFESMRQTATGDARRDYLARQISFYEDLVLFLSYENRVEEAYGALEKGRARLLAETLAARGLAASLPSLAELKRALPADTLLLSYTHGRVHQLQFVVDRHQATLARVGVDEHFHPPTEAGAGSAPAERSRGVALVADDEQGPATLEDAIRRYRALLKSPSSANAALIRAYGRAFYDMLIAPSESRLANRQELLVVPDGELGTLPFETLVDPQGRYLGERFRIRYVQSLTVWNQLRDRRYTTARKPLLALGGALYGPGPADTAAAPSRAGLTKWLDQALTDHRSLRPAYRTLGVTGWAPLPGTRDEVAAIAKVVPGTEAMLGEAVAEDRLKARSARGELEGYQVIHFATHGLVVPGAPELSALVLSQFPQDHAGEDGYMRMAEIAQLRLKADFVNLSACETGLGQVVGGEGIVGLAQSLLVAGANGASVSLWQVADESTAQLMTALYEEVQRSHVGYAEALARVKRRFIRGEFGDRYKAPYYWAPFVYYGL
jgi:CHAT domain-containing protein